MNTNHHSDRYLGLMVTASDRNAKITVERSNKKDGVIRFGDKFSAYMDMESLRDLCNDIADVLDTWFDEQDRGEL